MLARRRMVRNYTEQPVDGEALDRIAAAALRAPSAGNSQAVGVVIVTDGKTRERIAAIADEPAYLDSMPASIHGSRRLPRTW